MNTNQCDIGLIGLAVMGENLVLNMESKGFLRRRFQSHDGSHGKIRRRIAPKEKHPADAHDGRICRRSQTPAQSDDHGQSGRRPSTPSSANSLRCSRKATSLSTAETRFSPTPSGAARIWKRREFTSLGCGFPAAKKAR